LILGAHEMGHYLACRYYRIPATLPFFIPGIPPLGSFGAVFGMLGLNKLPQLYHSLFNSKNFARATDDRFFIAIEARDPRYHTDDTTKFLEETGALSVEEVED
ncbi:MAG: DUF3341 domain-containing protein, partial [Nannocystaceae bacterium]|nr:DUF3341 domain-containing protein [Nannocystaceae bacterium]